MSKTDINVLIVVFIGIIGLGLTGGIVWGFLFVPDVPDISPLTALVQSVITGLLGIVVGKSLPSK